MPHTLVSTATTTPISLGLVDAVIVTSNGSIAAATGPAITHSSSLVNGSYLLINGDISSLGDAAVRLSGTSSGTVTGLGNHDVWIGVTGTVTGSSDGIAIAGRDNDVINAGTILAGLYGISSDGSNAQINNSGTIIASFGINLFGSSGSSTVINTGTINADVAAVTISNDAAQIINSGTMAAMAYSVIRLQPTSTTGRSVIENTGDIIGNTVAIEVFGSGGGGVDVINAGYIAGDIEFESTNDLYDGRGGTISGQVRGGQGNDTYIIDDATIDIYEAPTGFEEITPAGGIDTVQTTVTYRLLNGFENLTLIGNGDTNGFGNSADNFMLGNIGDNMLFGRAGADTINGDDGKDTLYGGGGMDVLFGGEEDDLIFGGGANDVAVGGFGNDGDDTLSGDRGDDSLDGEDGDDLLLGGVGNDTLRGGEDNDTAEGGQGDDSIDGDNGEDLLIGGMGDDTINGGTDSDTIDGGTGEDSLSGGDGVDLVVGGLGNDTMGGGNENDTLEGGSGLDSMNGDDGDDLLDGGDDNDRLFGGLNNDTLLGGDGNDVLNGQGGNDVLNGGVGVDQMVGGGGNDVFQFTPEDTTGLSSDRINDFTSGADKIDLSALSSGEIAFLTSGGFSNAGTGEVRVLSISSGTRILVDNDGDGTSDFRIDLLGYSGSIGAGDFIL